MVSIPSPWKGWADVKAKPENRDTASQSHPRGRGGLTLVAERYGGLYPSQSHPRGRGGLTKKIWIDALRSGSQSHPRGRGGLT